MKFKLRTLLVVVLLAAAGITWWEYAPPATFLMDAGRKKQFTKWQDHINACEQAYALQVDTWRQDKIQSQLQEAVNRFLPSRNWTPHGKRHFVLPLPESEWEETPFFKYKVPEKWIIIDLPRFSVEEKHMMLEELENKGRPQTTGGDGG